MSKAALPTLTARMNRHTHGMNIRCFLQGLLCHKRSAFVTVALQLAAFGPRSPGGVNWQIQVLNPHTHCMKIHFLQEATVLLLDGLL
jgi:hypothetical protein